MLKLFTQWILGLILLLSQSAWGQSDPSSERLEELLGRLYLNHKSLSVVYSKLHSTALDAVGGSDQQLGYIQKTYLFVSEANLICRSQWELLSIANTIKDRHRSDYFTLRVKGLEWAAFESRDRVVSLNLYAAYIENAEPRKLIEEAVGLIEANIDMYDELATLLEPLTNPPNPYGRNRKES
jgi:hypothetical protein